MIKGILLHVSAMLLIAGGDAAAQNPAKVHRVGFIASTSPVSELLTVNPAARGFARGLRELGYIEGRNLIIEWRTAGGKFERFPEIVWKIYGEPLHDVHINSLIARDRCV